ncbi:LysR family transcriptional regulator [Priestia megaterium]|uniref:LysR family transcriptional regulator n=1 Tax=Priestia megaterium TaxID=1404 RepID=UPI000BEBC49B|nr:LysR family transcriptional regulator [Priestia megaterium]PEB61183.1 LysR family transcriptional regulator [Priestia megaterium]PEE73893.1 LysR family transcriptional regulator [Priestia megaterium]PFI84037.1 LysR family transcriptional regulator [Priestia megaterium]PGR04497.1 LysR family transcriptional regulator [Priestia megaterium]
MNYRDWEILKVLYIQKNITKAARLLFITQPALTNRIKHMEKELGANIVTRESRGIQFTPQGEYLVSCAEEALTNYQKIKDNVFNMSNNIHNEIVGTLKLGVSNFFANYKLPHILKSFKKQYPHVQFKIITGWSKDISQLIHKKDVHIGFVRGDYGCKGLSSHLLFEETICITSIEEIDINNLPTVPRIDYKGDHLLKLLIDNWWSENYVQEPFISIEVDQVETCREMVINGLGYAILPDRILTNMKGLHKIDLEDQKGNPMMRRTWMYYHEESLEWNVMRKFVDFVEKETF